MATMVGTQSNISGIALGFLLPGLFINSYSENDILDDSNRPVYKQQILNMLVAVSIFATVACVLVIFTFREKPGMPLWGKREVE